MEQQTTAAVSGGNLVAKEGWSWGACMFNAAFLVAIKKYDMLWWYLLSFIPVVNVIFFVAFAIYLGLHGHELAAKSTQFSSQEEHNGFTKAVDHAGKIFFFVAVAVLAVSLLLAMLGASFAFFHLFTNNGSFPGIR